MEIIAERAKLTTQQRKMRKQLKKVKKEAIELSLLVLLLKEKQVLEMILFMSWKIGRRQRLFLIASG